MKMKVFYNNIKNFLGKFAFRYFIFTIVEQLITVVCLNTVIAFAAQYAVNAAAEQDMHYLYVAGIIIAVAMSIAMVGIPITSFLSNKCVKEVMTRLKADFYEHVILLKKEDCSKYHMGNLISYFTDDLNQIEDLYGTKIKRLISVCLIGPISIGAILSLNWILGLAVLVFGMISVWVTRICANKNKVLSEKVQNNKSESSSKLIDLLNNLEAIKSLGISEIVHKRYADTCLTVEESTRRRSGVESVIALFTGFMFYFKQIAILTIGIILLKNGFLTIGDIIASAYLLSNAGYMFDNIGAFYADVQKSIVSVERIQNFLNLEDENVSLDMTERQEQEFDVCSPIIEFDNVSFAYNPEKMILKNMCMQIQKGEYTAIVGPSGSGKSTIVKLLLGFYTNSSGTIRIGGRKINDYSVSQLRELSAYVPQEPYLFPGTIKENIQYGKWNATPDEIRKASEKALCHDFIMELSDGYDTVINSETTLSGGQIQRIAIARALLKEASIMLLDEPTAALDAESEKQVLETLEGLRNDITIIVITHKMYTIETCDKKYMLQS